MELSQLLGNLPKYQIESPPPPTEITKITADSRQVEPDTLFVAYPGVSVDGHKFIPAAIAAGAAAIIHQSPIPHPTPVLSEAEVSHIPHPILIKVPDSRQALAYLSAAWYNFPAHQLTMVGITGTDGKTTTINFLYHMLAVAKKRVGMISTVNAVIGENVLETGLHTTTPDAPDVQRYLAEMVKNSTAICLLETTSHGLAQHRVSACDFDIAIVTNITHEHLDIHGSLDAYRQAKASLFESLATAADKGTQKTAVLNCDDWSFEFLRDKLDAAGTTWLGYSVNNHPQATVKAHNITCRPDKTTFAIEGPGYTFEAETILIGDYNISNCLAAATAAIELLDLPPNQVKQGIAAMPGVPGRMERLDEGQPFTAVVDFAHTPNSLRRALTAAKNLTDGRVIAVFGCAGLRDVDKRVMMGQIAAELADITIITAEDPRTEVLDEIIATTANTMLAQGAVEGQTFERIPDRGRAIFRAVQLAQPGDMVLAFGKGHEQSMCFGQTEYPWDDCNALRAALNGKPLLTLPSVDW